MQAVQYNVQGIKRVITDRDAVEIDELPVIWQSLARMRGTTNLSDEARANYVEMARYFACNASAGTLEALVSLGHDFDRDRYPDLGALQAGAADVYTARVLAATADLFNAFGHDVPASFYQLFVHLALNGKFDMGIKMFRDEATMKRDTLWDAVMHSALAAGPIGLYMQSVLSQHGLTFLHLWGCSCIVAETKEAPFTISIDPALKTSYLQNMMAGAIKQYEI